MERRLALAALLALAAAPAAGRAADPLSFARPDEVSVRHLALDLDVDFDARRLAGSAELALDRRSGARALVLDTRDLEIFETRTDDGGAVPFSLGAPDARLGRSLTIPLGEKTSKVTIHYRTSPEARALLWLDPQQTSGKRWPFLFTQSQAIDARSWIPCQDTPAVRMTYEARVRVPAELVALMSAENPTGRSADGVYRFRMAQPVPSYLLALAVGDLAYRPLGARTGVYAEPGIVEKAAWELAETEAMMTAAERLYGPYRWGRYDLLVLPPSFPYGGMENPRLTFATPTILAGDRSLTALVAHELAHSWSGNLVTNATWADFWLNEGFTSYIENRIMEEVAGVEIAEMLAQLSRADLDAAIAELGNDSKATALYDPTRDTEDDSGTVGYEKGFLFLRTLERTFGRARFDAFLRKYFDTFAFQSMTTPGFVDYLEKNLLPQDPAAAKKIDVHAWVYGLGIPDGAATASSAAFAKVDKELAKLAAGNPPASLETKAWVTQQWLHFLAGLPNVVKTPAGLASLDETFRFATSGNSEVFVAWAQIGVASGYQPVMPALETFLLSVGRAKFLYPLYGALAKSPDKLAWARDVYRRASPGYHPAIRPGLERTIGFSPGEKR